MNHIRFLYMDPFIWLFFIILYFFLYCSMPLSFFICFQFFFSSPIECVRAPDFNDTPFIFFLFFRSVLPFYFTGLLFSYTHVWVRVYVCALPPEMKFGSDRAGNDWRLWIGRIAGSKNAADGTKVRSGHFKALQLRISFCSCVLFLLSLAQRELSVRCIEKKKYAERGASWFTKISSSFRVHFVYKLLLVYRYVFTCKLFSISVTCVLF